MLRCEAPRWPQHPGGGPSTAASPFRAACPPRLPTVSGFHFQRSFFERGVLQGSIRCSYRFSRNRPCPPFECARGRAGNRRRDVWPLVERLPRLPRRSATAGGHLVSVNKRGTASLQRFSSAETPGEAGDIGGD